MRIANLTRTIAFACLLSVSFPATSSIADGVAERANQILDDSGVQGGFVVQVGCGDGTLLAALRQDTGYQVHGLDRDRSNVARARKHVRSRGLYGPVSVDHLRGDRLPYVDNLVNLIVSDDLGPVSKDEVMRVLAPKGVAYIQEGGTWTQTVKPRPEDIDEWTHYLHDAGGNAVAHDDVVGPPRRLQWIGSPRWSRHHDRMASMSALVSSGGRIIYVMDEGSRVSIQLPSKWTVIARDAFNGTILWKKPIGQWHSHLWPLKSGPTQLARRLVATPEVVYVTLGFQAPLTALDAVTGETIRTYEQTNATEEMILADGILLLLVNPGESELSDFAPLHNVGDQKRVREFREFHWNEQARTVMAIDAESGRTLWQKQSVIAPLTLSADDARVFFHDGEKIVCLDRSSGSEVWTSPPATRRNAVTMNFGPKLVVHGGTVLFAGGDRKMAAFSAANGAALWTSPHAQSGYQSPEDVLVAGGLVWNAPTTSTKDTGIFTGRDLKTGKVVQEFPPDVTTYWFHHRCYIAKATDRFLMPSRTGIEFVDFEKQSWDINHWVRGGCLYGVMPCNGLVYAPPHNCACYPEAKLYGFNALAPARSDLDADLQAETDRKARLETGPAYRNIETDQASGSDTADWPTYRGDVARSGFTPHEVPLELKSSWQTELGGKLSSVVVAGGKLFVAQVDEHTVHALDTESGEPLWSYMAGGRIDSPPTVHEGRVVFGSADGWVYCLRASDGELAWRFQAAPYDRRLMAFEQLESVWPVHGSVLCEDGMVFFVAGRSNYLDGGLRWYKLDIETGRALAEATIDERDPETGTNLQSRLQVLNMPTGLPDVLSSDGRYVYMRSQQFDRQGNRLGLGPHSGKPEEQGSVQRGDSAHLFAPMGFLDETWFHRSYWVYGRSFAGGHAGFYQAGKYAPSGRILVFDDDNVYGFCRKPQYYKWTTILEHHLFAANKEAPQVDLKAARRGRDGSMVRFANSASLDPTGKALTVEAWVKPEKPNGVILARGGPSFGYVLFVKNGRPRFAVRTSSEQLATASATRSIVNEWAHVAGVLSEDHELRLYVNGELVATEKAAGLIAADPAQTMEIGADDQGAVGDYNSPYVLAGTVDEVRLYHRELTAQEVKSHYEHSNQAVSEDADLVLFCSFDNGDATDRSGRNNHGQASGARIVAGKVGTAIRFAGRVNQANRRAGSFVKHHWTRDMPLFVRAMVLTGKTIFVAGPPDIMDEEETFRLLAVRDSSVNELLAKQDAALEGSQGGLLRAISADDGRLLAEYKLPSLPNWDGMAAANGRLYSSTTDGKVVCFASP